VVEGVVVAAMWMKEEEGAEGVAEVASSFHLVEAMEAY
jgi:hypothetical protein